MTRFRAKAGRSRPTPGRMNKTEAAYAADLARRGLRWRYDTMPLRLADRTFYHADFVVYQHDGTIEYHEVKGSHWEDDARVKIKVAAEMYDEFAFYGVTRDRKTGLWVYEPFGAAAKEMMNT